MVNVGMLERVKPPPPAADGMRARILVVDDHPANLVALDAILAPLGADVVKVTSGEAALRELLQGDVAVVLMDVHMPGLDGFETAALIRKRERNRCTPIVFLTANARDPRLVVHGYAQGAVDYLVKPFDADILRGKVSVFVELWKKAELVKKQEALLRAQEVRDLERRTEGRFRAIIDSMPACVWVARRDGEIAYCNRLWTEYAGAGMSFFAAVPADEATALRAAWDEAIREGQPMEREQRLRRRDGHYRWHLLRVAPEKDTSGAVLGFIATAADIDHHKRVEEAHAALLAREQQAREQAEVANRTKDEFLATVSHELRTPLSAILGWTRILRAKGVRAGDELGRALSTIERNARAQAQLIEDILDVSRIIAGKLRLQVRAIDLVPLVQAAVEGLRPVAEAKSLEIDVRVPGSLAFDGDPDRLQQVFANLLSNAIKYTESGKVIVEARRNERHAEVIFSDTGIGISPEFLPHVFERFRQAEGASGGLGLGLAIVRHLVEVHGGSVLAESDGEGRGARFTVRLPVRDEPRVSGGAAGRAAARPA
jgi:PAS domain S-box-containing protein